MPFWGSRSILSDSAAENRGYKIEDVEHNYNISRHHYSKPEYQNQNWVENKIGHIKNMVNNIMDIMGISAGCWLICTMYIIALMQLILQPSLGGISSIQKVTGCIQDTSNVYIITGGSRFIISTAMPLIQAKAIRN